MISVVVLQNRVDLLNGDIGSSRKTCVTSRLDGNDTTVTEAKRVSHTGEELYQEQTTILVIQTEANVSCMHISYHIYPELPSPISVCPCETKI